MDHLLLHMFYDTPPSVVIVFLWYSTLIIWFEEFFFTTESFLIACVTEASPVQAKLDISFSVSRSPRHVGIMSSYFNRGRAQLGVYEGFSLT